MAAELQLTGTSLPNGKVSTFAKIASQMLAQWDYLEDQTIARQMLAEGLRKIHDNATSSRGKGKYLGHSLWSKNALALLGEAKGNVRSISSELAHEHVVPVAVVIDKLLALGKSPDASACEALIRKWSIVAIVTRAENRLLSSAGLKNAMPDLWDDDDCWARYRAVGLLGSILCPA